MRSADPRSRRPGSAGCPPPAGRRVLDDRALARIDVGRTMRWRCRSRPRGCGTRSLGRARPLPVTTMPAVRTAGRAWPAAGGCPAAPPSSTARAAEPHRVRADGDAGAGVIRDEPLPGAHLGERGLGAGDWGLSTRAAGHAVRQSADRPLRTLLLPPPRRQPRSPAPVLGEPSVPVPSPQPRNRLLGIVVGLWKSSPAGRTGRSTCQARSAGRGRAS